MGLPNDISGSAGGQGASGASDDTQNNKPSTDDSGDAGDGASGASSTVSREAHERLLGQRKADQEKLKQTQARIAELERANREREEAELKKKGDLEQILKNREKEIAKLKGEVETREKTLRDGAKLQAFAEKLPGKIKRKEYLAFVDLDSIPVDENGRPDQSSLESAVQGFVENHGELIETHGPDARLPGGAAKPNGKIPYAEWQKLSLRDKKKRWDDVDWGS